MEITGLSKDNIEQISKIKKENEWVLDYRLKAYESFLEQDMPQFGPHIDLDFSKVIYYKSIEADQKLENNWQNIF